MSKNFASIYAGGNDSTAVDQMFFIKEETTRGTLIACTGADYFYTLQGGSVTFAQALAPSGHRSGRHMQNTVKEKKTCEWSIPTYINIDSDAVQGTAELEAGISLLWESLLGRKTVPAGVLFDAVTAPAKTFSLFHIGDAWSEQVRGGFVQQGEISLPGDGQSQITWSGNAKDRFLVGIGKSITANAANEVTLAAGEARRFPVGSLVMIVKSNGTTRSTDTATPRTVTASNTGTDVVTLSGAVLTDADGTVNPVYLAYWEPSTITSGIDEPQTGLVGTVAIDTFPSAACVRNATITINNNHELVNYCFGADSLSGPLYIPGSKLEVTVSMEMNLNAKMVEYLNKLNTFLGNAIEITVGDLAARYFKVDLPKVIFSIPAISVPESGSIPVTFEGTAYQTALDTGDEITVSYL